MTGEKFIGQFIDPIRGEGMDEGGSKGESLFQSAACFPLLENMKSGVRPK